MLGGEDGFGKCDKYQYGQKVLISPHLRLVKRVTDGKHTSQADNQRNDNGYRHAAHYGAVEPIVPIAVIEKECYLHEQQRPKQASQPVDAEQRKFLYHTEMTGAAVHYQQINQHKRTYKEVHIAPVVVIHKVGSCQIGQLHTAQYNDVQ